MKIRSALFFMVLFFNAFLFPTSKGEDLTTLDGQIFMNISEVTKYPQFIYFTYNGDRKSVQNTNLPKEFKEKFNIVIKTNLPVTV
jgi:hypothetical protein